MITWIDTSQWRNTIRPRSVYLKTKRRTIGPWSTSADKLPDLRAKRITFSAFAPGGDFELRDGSIRYRDQAILILADTQLRGAHNAENLMAAFGVGLTRGLSFDQMRTPLCEYKPLPHRCEPIRTIGDVEWVNDSKGTNPDSVEKALLGETRPVVLIVGGKDKGFEYSMLTDLVATKCRLRGDAR
jgi:UDP-N-acetylmuramoylalanine--D-glutamate ligase